MTPRELDKKAREIQTTHYIEVDLGSYKIKRSLFYSEALKKIKKDSLEYYIEE